MKSEISRIRENQVNIDNAFNLNLNRNEACKGLNRKEFFKAAASELNMDNDYFENRMSQPKSFVASKAIIQDFYRKVNQNYDN